VNLIIGASGILGSAIRKRLPTSYAPDRSMYDLTDDPSVLPDVAVAYLCAGTKGYRECEGNLQAFRADVDGNLRLAKYLLKRGTFVVFVSTDGVEWGANVAYSRNRLLVEMALVMQPNVAIVRPAKFSADTVGPLADLCISVGEGRKDGLHYWRPDANG